MLITATISEQSKRSHQRCSMKKKVFLQISKNSQENTCAKVSFLIKLLAWPETLAQVFSCEFCKISKNSFLQNTSG